ncbi:MAG TPA: serine/threonine-protein kinase [Gemmatimonadaceae bacterium]|nr:serine/threonine-protein kinase [Gemmatimonadaceae bacterium]
MDGTPGLQSGTFAGRYTIERELGRGATATVYLARDTQRGHGVAIKVLRPELAESLGAERFLREIKVNERLHHPHIASVLDSGQHDGQLYFVLPHMEGGSLRQMLQRDKQLPIEAAVSITKTVALALDYAHRQGLIHRDVKPENILFTSGQACLADFGIARAIERAIDESTTSTGLVRGTPAYMSPEQASGSRTYDGRSDQYSLACVLYEMLAGVPAFIGPTPEAVIAMRFQHPPRDVRVYRSTVSPALEQVINRALSLLPADRYDTLADFSAAMEAAMRAPIVESRTSGPTLGPQRSRRWAFLGATVVAVVGLVVLIGSVRSVLSNHKIAPDTSAYLVLPIEGGAADSAHVYDRLTQDMSRWQGITVVDPFTARGALGRDTVNVSAERAAAVALDMRAGRYVRARLARVGTQARVYGAVFDATDGSRLFEASVSIPSSAPAVDSVFARLADELLLRRTLAAPVRITSTLPAMQQYFAAMAAREAFNLPAADSLFLAALEADHDFSQAALRLAEVRAWREEPRATWAPWAQRAAGGSRLSPDERALAGALLEGPDASAMPCRGYRTLATRHRDDMSAWYGFAMCLRRDDAVEHDPRSPSGWKFRTSYHEAIRAFVRAFALAPALHKTFQPGGYDRLRRSLFTGSRMLRSGVSVPDSMRFFAYPSWTGDSLAFVPYPAAAIGRPVAVNEIRSREMAVRKQREVFRDVARAWGTALPNNPAIKELVAISLEMFGDPSALDTLHLARAIAVDGDHRARLGAEEVLMRISFGRSNARLLSHVNDLADSLLSEASTASGDQASTLAPVAAVLGRCRVASSLVARNLDPRFAAFARVPMRVAAAAESLSVRAAVGCDDVTDSAGMAMVGAAIRDAHRDVDDATLAQLEYGVLARTVRLARAPSTTMLKRFAAAGSDEFLKARIAVTSGRLRDATTLLSPVLVRQQRGSAPDQSPDLMFMEAELLTALRDTATALRVMDPILDRQSWLELLLDRPIDAAVLMRAAALRADIADRVHDTRRSRDWAAFVAAVWADADQSLQPTAKRMKDIARGH